MGNLQNSILFEVEVPGRVGIKKNGKQVFRRGLKTIVIPSDRYLQWERMAETYYRKAFHRISPIEGPLRAEYYFYFKNRSAEPDVSNCIEGPQDLLEKVGIIKNDKQIIELVAKKAFDGNPRIVLRLTKATEA